MKFPDLSHIYLARQTSPRRGQIHTCLSHQMTRRTSSPRETHPILTRHSDETRAGPIIVTCIFQERLSNQPAHVLANVIITEIIGVQEPLALFISPLIKRFIARHILCAHNRTLRRERQMMMTMMRGELLDALPNCLCVFTVPCSRVSMSA